MLEIKNLDAGFGKFGILKEINLHVKPSEIVALIGPNGAGKSTILKSIFGITDIRKGNIIFKEQDITRIDTHELLELGISYVPQGKINFSNLTVDENLDIGAKFLKENEIREKRKEFVFSKFHVLKEKRKKPAFSLSGGQQQMLALGRALMQNPSLLLLDEPSLGLSPKLMKELFQIIKSLKQDGISILLVEQNAKKAIEIADRTYVLENGAIVLEGDRKILKDKRIRNVYLGGEY